MTAGRVLTAERDSQVSVRVRLEKVLCVSLEHTGLGDFRKLLLSLQSKTALCLVQNHCAHFQPAADGGLARSAHPCPRRVCVHLTGSSLECQTGQSCVGAAQGEGPHPTLSEAISNVHPQDTQSQV